MAHPQHNFTSNFNGSEDHNAELTLNINGVEQQYTPAGNDQTYNVPGVARIDIDLDGAELVQAIQTVLDGAAQPVLVEMSIYDEETVFQYIGELDNKWCFAICTTEMITTVSVSKEDGAISDLQVPVGNGIVIVQAETPNVYTQLRAAIARGQLPVLKRSIIIPETPDTIRNFYYWPTTRAGTDGDFSLMGCDGQHSEIATVHIDNSITYTTVEVPTASTASPLMAGIASAGSSAQWSRGDHVHPTDTSREAAANKTTTVRQNGQADNTKFPTEAAVRTAIDSAVSSAYHVAGSKTVAQLISSLLVSANEGDVYNITDSGTTTADFIEGAGHPISVGDNVVVCDVGGGVYKFDLLSGFVDLTNYLTKTGDGSDVTASFTAASTRTNVVTGEKLSALFGKVAKWFGDLKALAFKDKVDTVDVEDDAVTADKVKDNETLPVNITGSAKSLSSSLCTYGSSGSKFRLVAKSAPLSNTVNVHFECRMSASSYNLFQSATLSFNAVYSESTSSIVFSGAKVINDHGSSNLWKFYLVPNVAEQKVEIYAESTGSTFNSLNLIALFANGEAQNYVNGTTYFNTVVNSVPTPNVVVPVMKAVATETGVGSATQPVYVDNDGVPQPCENRIHDLTLQRKIIKIVGEMTGRFLLCDRQNWTGTVGSPEFTPVDPYELAVWINRGDVIQVDFTTWDWWGDKFPGLIVEAHCSTLSGDTRFICTNLRVLREKIVNQQPTVDFQWSDLILDEDTNTRYMEFQGI